MFSSPSNNHGVGKGHFVTKKTSQDSLQSEESPSQTESAAEDSAQDNLDETLESEVLEPNLEPEETLEIEVTPENTKPKSSTSFLTLIFGGIVAAGIGFGLAQLVPDGWPISAADTSEIEQKLETHSTEIDKIKQSIQDQGAAIDQRISRTDFEKLSTNISSSEESLVSDREAAISAVKSQLDALETRLTDLEKQPIRNSEASSVAAAAYERELTTLRESLAEQKGEIEAAANDAKDQIAEAKSQAEDLKAGAEAKASAALSRAAVTRINAALSNGGPFEEALHDLADASNTEPQAALMETSKTGVATLAELRRDFPEAARAALATTTADTSAESSLDRIGAFFRAQTGARSLKPREGSDPDAVLSRAEASVADGKLEKALTLIAELPPEASKQMEYWAESAQNRLDTKEAIDALAASATQN